LPYWNEQYVGLGPYKVREWVSGSHTLLDANGEYVLGRPKIDQIDVLFFLDTDTLYANLLAGTVDITLGRGLSLEQALQLRGQWRDGRVETSTANAVQIQPQFNNPQPPIVSDVRLRRALLMAIDRQQMVETLEAGMSTIADAWVGPSDPEFEDIQSRIVRYPYDGQQAAQLIEDIGYTRGADGFYRDAAGQQLSIGLRTTESNDIQPKSMFPVADYWQRIGVAVEPAIIPRQLAANFEYRATFPAFELQRGPSDPSVLSNLRSTEARTAANNYSGGNYANYRNAELDTLIDTYLTTIPLQSRHEVEGEIVHHMTDQVVVLGLFYDTEATAMNKRLQNVAARNKNSTQAWNVQQWDATP